MKIGIGLPNLVRDVRPEVLPEWARRAEAAGFSSLGAGSRIAFPGVMDTVTLAAAAGATSTIGLVSNVLVTPVWPPVLLAKEIAGIQGVSGGRLTLGLGVGGRPEDFVVEGAGPRGLGKRMDHALEVFRDFWAGTPVPGSESAGVPGGRVEIPMLFGGTAPAALNRMAKWGKGYIAGTVPPPLAASWFDGARQAWKDAGREGDPYLVGTAYFALGDFEKGRGNVYDYYSSLGPEVAGLTSGAVAGDTSAVRDVVKQYEDLGIDELFFNAATDDPDEVERLAEAVR
ncbi:LLM class flavin-dependent oxidoreductase [Amycolatopsis sp. MtRt-6]|uniref:LLM class flavin-dependent oxidoreductase n=1 Tax=Amycolatopsis sp. MtRt-6 TaxID=2792782 RepID=UPI001A8E138E|nr:LLM class flavin-dependent oxidoreductase [Amycolatopsis sp. MtRt-6]